MREDECYNCVHMRDNHRDALGDCAVYECDCLEWIPLPKDEPKGDGTTLSSAHGSKDGKLKIMKNVLLFGDCLKVMSNLADKSIDFILCDLPYGVTAQNKWDVIIPFEPLWKQYERIIKDTGAIALTATEPFSSLLVVSKPKMFRYDLIWEKPLATGFLNANRMPLRNHEQILIFYKHLPTYNPQKTKGKPYRMTRREVGSNYNTVKVVHHETLNDTGDRFPMSVRRFSHDKEKLHSTQKPVALFEYLIRTFTNEEDVVLDNAAGSCTTAIACLNTKRQYICIEKDSYFFKLGKERILKHTAANERINE